MTRIGLIGGSFDPIHVGHLIIAREVRTRLDLSQVVFVPAGQPPHKLDREMTDAERRFEMVQLAIAGNPHFSVSPVDIDRPGPCYSVDTVRLVRDAWGTGVEVYFVIGADSLAELPTWHQPQCLLRLCHVVAVGRPGYCVDWGQLERLLPDASSIVYLPDTSLVDVSATEIRRRVRQGRSIRGMVPLAVERYIYAHDLYRDAEHTETRG